MKTAAAAIATFLRDAYATARTLVTALAPRWSAAGMGTHSPLAQMNGHCPLHPRRRKAPAACRVERAVIEDWVMWRR